MSDRQRATMTVGHQDGKVVAQLPEFYLELTPEQARKWAAALFTHAAKAEGREVPQIVMLDSN